MKLVTDTNVVVSGLLWMGAPGRLLEAAAAGQVTLYTSAALIAELSTTLTYDKLAERIRRSGLTHPAYLAYPSTSATHRRLNTPEPGARHRSRAPVTFARSS